MSTPSEIFAELTKNGKCDSANAATKIEYLQTLYADQRVTTTVQCLRSYDRIIIWMMLDPGLVGLLGDDVLEKVRQLKNAVDAAAKTIPQNQIKTLHNSFKNSATCKR
jgi:hypothetical protein